jgi:L-ascorbate metabolism protein UlaG (beta-lactamase superfamily)
MSIVWRTVTNLVKTRPSVMQLVARLDRGRGRMRFLDQINPPPKPQSHPDLTGWEDRELAAAWIGHATILLRLGGMTILTDPVFSNRIGLGLWLSTLGPRRRFAAAIDVRHLPKLDLILLSHAHFDHLDRPTLARLPKQTPVIMANQTSDLISDLGFSNITELRWGESHSLNGLKVTAQQVQHWGARTFVDRHRGFNAYVLHTSKHRVLYGGDTAYHELFKDIPKVDLAILGIGAYDPYIHAHANPEQALMMADHVRADFVLPMHHSTFRLSREPWQEPMERILAAAGRDESRIAIRQIGGTWVHGN